MFSHLDGISFFINACESGSGPINTGEGVMSLGLACTLAGAESVIQHSWKADDEAAGQISVSYYRKSRFFSKARALQKAKEQYIKQAPQGKGHPSYWAGMVYYGPEGSQNRNIPLALFLGILILAAAVGSIVHLRNQ